MTEAPGQPRLLLALSQEQIVEGQQQPGPMELVEVKMMVGSIA
jgi:hypothetical protein